MRRLLIALALASITLPACEGINTEGEAGVLRFAYDDPDDFLTEALSASVATGTEAVVMVSLVNNGQVQLKSARSGMPSVATVRVEGAQLIVSGVAPGEATLEVETDQGSDQVTITVEDAATVSVSSSFERVLVGGTEALMVKRTDADGHAMVGEAHTEATFEPAEAAERADGPNHRVMAHYLAAGEVAVHTGTATLSRTVVALTEVEQFNLHMSTAEDDTRAFGAMEVFGFQALDVGGTELGGLIDLVEIEIADEAICTVRQGDFLGLAGFAATYHAAGTCQLTLRLGSHELEVTREVGADVE
jgi:hypothetical protein